MLRSTTFLGLALLAGLAGGCGPGGEARSADGASLSPEALARPSPDARATDPSPAVPADAPRVVFLGDSISAGLHLEPGQAFPALLQRTLAAEGHPFQLVNAGVSGDTSAGGLRRLDWLLEQEPEVLVVELGGNDGLRGQPLGEIEARLREIVQRAQAAGARVLLLGVRVPPSLGAEYAGGFEAIYPRLAQELDCALVPYFMEGTAGVPGQMLEDGIHPSAAGHARLAENVAPALRELLRR
ncbi:MAG: arylesterase [Planctomycetota bacterium]